MENRGSTGVSRSFIDCLIIRRGCRERCLAFDSRCSIFGLRFSILVLRSSILNSCFLVSSQLDNGVGQALALDELHGVVVNAAFIADGVNGNDVRMVQDRKSVV